MGLSSGKADETVNALK